MRKITFLGVIMLFSLLISSVKAQTTPLDLSTVDGSITMGYYDVAPLSGSAPTWITKTSLPTADTKDGKCGTATATFAMKSGVSMTFYLTKCDQMVVNGNIATGRGLTVSINGGASTTLLGTGSCHDFTVPVNSDDACTIKVSGLNSNAAYTSFFTFTYGIKTVPTISLGSGLTSQTVYQTQAIKPIVYQYGGTATSASIVWTGTTGGSNVAPDGVTVTTDATAKTVTISGALTTLGSYGYSITSTDGINTAAVLTGTLNTKTTTKYKMAYVTTVTNGAPAAGDLYFINGITNNPGNDGFSKDFDLTYINATDTGVDYSIYDVILEGAIPPSGSAGLTELKTKCLSKPFVNMKEFQLQSSAWNWATPANTSATTMIVADAAKTHPIFSGITFTGAASNEIVLTTATTGNMAVNLTAWAGTPTPAVPTTLSTVKDPTSGLSTGLACYFEIPVGTTMNGMSTPTSARQIVLGLSEATYTTTNLLTADAITLAVNAAKYVIVPIAPSMVRLTSGSTNQTVSDGVSISNVVYTYVSTVTSTSVAWTGTANSTTAPNGITVATDASAKTITISGTPIILGVYGYSVSATDGALVTTLTGTLTVAPPPSLALTSASGTDNQTVAFCQNFTDIVYTFGGTTSSTAITWTGTSAVGTLPAGIKVVTDNTAKTVTISGMPYVTGNYGYSITATDGTVVTAPLTGSIISSATTAALHSFPGAVGYGSHATGGRNGSVYHVTNLNDSGAGSFRDAVSASNRIVVFDVSGYINLLTAVSAKSNLTIAGQTASGEGIGFLGGEISFANSSNIICRNIRIVPGSQTPSDKDDALSLYLARNVIMDHCTFEFAPWNNIDGVSDNYTVYPVTGITLQNCIDANPTGQQFGAHCESVISQWTFYRNLFANSHNRNPLAKINDEFINNVEYNNEAGYTTHTSTSFKHDIVNNYFIWGPASGNNVPWFQMDGNQSIYHSGDLCDTNLDGNLNGTTTNIDWYSGTASTLLTSPWSPLTATIPTADATSAFRIVTSTVGTLPLSQLDSMIINQVKTLGQGTAGSSAGTTGPSAGLYTTQTVTGLPNNGYGIIRSGVQSVDTDKDGMPDYWETATGSNVNADDAMTIAPDGYTLIEHYLNWLAGIHAVSNINSSVDIDLNKYTGGFTSVSPVFQLSSNVNGTAVLSADNHTVHFTPAANFFGLGSFKFTVTGSDNTSYTDTVSVLVSNFVTDWVPEVTNNISVYPNPASHLLTLQNSEAGTFEIYDISGRLALKGQTSQAGSNQQIDISKLNDGAFTLKVTSNHVSSSMNFIKKQ